jgi:3-dehydroquinate dehydratase-2
VSYLVAVLHGPNLNLLGTREPDVYGTVTLAEIDAALLERAQRRGARLTSFQTNHEGELVERIQRARGDADAIVINPGAYTHTSIAIADALAAVALPTVEVHLSNIYKREEFRRQSLIAPHCVGTIAGFGARSYYLALDAVIDLLEERQINRGGAP